MSEERFETWLRENADGYHRPPDEVPRDAMWESIARTRAGQPTASRIAHRTSLVRYALAASVLLAAGIGLGFWMRGAAEVARPVASSTPAPADADVPDATYEAASVQHLAAAEAMLTSFKSPERVETEQALRRSARDLLASTRLLLDSPAGDEAGRRRLLEDLEYVLMRIVQLDPNAPAEDRAMVDRAIIREQVLTRIRSSISAGFPSGS